MNVPADEGAAMQHGGASILVAIPDATGTAPSGEVVVPHDVLRLIKHMRAQNIKVSIGDGTRPVRYGLRKGVADLLKDPVILLVIGLPLNVLTGLLANYLTGVFKRRSSPEPNPVNIVIEVQDGDRRVRYDYRGDPISDERFSEILRAAEEAASAHRAARQRRSPDAARPVPIFLEHTHEIIGWGTIKLEQGALKVENAKIDHGETCRRLDSGELSGFSIGGMASRATCSVCGGSYLGCEHVAGEDYGGQPCKVDVGDISLREISLVKDPVNQNAIVEVRK